MPLCLHSSLRGGQLAGRGAGGNRGFLFEPRCSSLLTPTNRVRVHRRTNLQELQVNGSRRVRVCGKHLPTPADELDAGAVALLRAAVQERAQAERHCIDAIRTARESGMSWAAIGAFVGTSGEAARQRYSR